jgi:predicted RNase H-like nuclease
MTQSLAGIDGYAKGWVIAVLDDHQIAWRTCTIHELRDTVADLELIGIDIPIQLVTTGWRSCDQETKKVLGKFGSRVFMTPPRAVLELGFQAPNEIVQALSLELTGQGVSRQAMALSERILAVNALLPDSRLYEVFPELVFAALDGGAAMPSKKSAAGAGARMRSLDPWLTTLGTSCALLMKKCPTDVPVDDALDALATLAGTLRISNGVAQRWPAKGKVPTIWA